MMTNSCTKNSLSPEEGTLVLGDEYCVFIWNMK